MNNPPPLMRDQRAVDQDHLNLLAIFHFVVAGMALVGIACLVMHYLLMSTVFSNPHMWEPKPGSTGAPPPPMPFQPKEFLAVFIWFYFIFGGALVLGAVCNVISGLFIRARKHRNFSIVISALNCLQIPFGTCLGVFTIVVLMRQSVNELYQNTPPETDPGPQVS
jgi:hypothetical protein